MRRIKPWVARVVVRGAESLACAVGPANGSAGSYRFQGVAPQIALCAFGMLIGFSPAQAQVDVLGINFESATPLTQAGFTFSSGVTAFEDRATNNGQWFDQSPYIGPTTGNRIHDTTDGTVMGFTRSASPPLGPNYSLAFAPSPTFAGFSAVSFQYSASVLTQLRFTNAAGAEVAVSGVTVSRTLDDARLPGVALQGGTTATYNLAGQFFDDECGNAVRATYCNWTNVSFLLAAPATQMNFNFDGSNGTALFDNYAFNMTRVVPEPSTFALMALGLAGIAMISRRRREA